MEVIHPFTVKILHFDNEDNPPRLYQIESYGYKTRREAEKAYKSFNDEIIFAKNHVMKERSTVQLWEGTQFVKEEEYNVSEAERDYRRYCEEE